MDERPPNRLIDATSPYLLQHARNPVDWYPWGDEAFAKAATEDRPVFLSVGYAACHWCHVMERESFEDEETARFLNERFVSIKVDREERPDVDGVYMDAVQAMNRGQGGWPMSVFLTADAKPFFAGTYYPDEPRHGMPSFRQVLAGIDEAWRERRDEIERAGDAITTTLEEVVDLRPSDDPLGADVTAAAVAALRRSFDTRWGGFGDAPKFPQPMTLEFLLRMAVRGQPDALEMLVLTLDRMAAGGMFDQLGGGFARYSVDDRWHVPHFEKMLPDTAQLLQLYARAWLVTRDDEHRSVAVRVGDYLLAEMQQPGGGFSSSQDADSEGIEGRFFTWSWDELVELVGPETAEAVGAVPAGNWVGEEGPINVLNRPLGGWTEQLVAARDRLHRVREDRVRPGTDDKVLAAWNGLAIRALCEAGRAFDEPRFVDAARRCAEFVWAELRRDDVLLRSWRAGVAGGPGFADDHAALAAGLLTLWETTGEVAWFDRARMLCDALLERFHDRERGGFFQTATDAERLIVRPKELYDNAVPSGASAAAEVLQRMSLFTGEPRYERAGFSALLLVRDAMMRAPTGFGHALSAVDLAVGPTQEIAIVGDPSAATTALIDEIVRVRYLPNAVLAVASPDDERASGSVALLADRPAVDGRPTAYVCTRFVCQRPVTTPADLAAALP